VALAPNTLKAVAAVEPVPNLTRLVGNSLTLLAVFSMVGVLTHAAQPADRARRSMRTQVVILVVSLVVMNMLFLSANTQFTVDFVDVYGSRPLIAAYELVFLSYASWGLIRLLLFAYPVARQSEQQFLRAGLRLVAAGAVVGLGWSLGKIVATVLKATTKQPVPIEGIMSSILSATAVALIALGATLTAWAPWITRPLRWLGAYHTCRQIEPLWSALRCAVPDVVRHPAKDVEFRLYRKVIEIRDSQLALRVFFHPQVTAWTATAAHANGIDGDDLAILMEAAVIAAALEAQRIGHRYQSDSCTVPELRPLAPSIDAEARWLIRVSAAFTRSPIVAAIRQRVRAELANTVLNNRQSLPE
jgi:hypothetical protein